MSEARDNPIIKALHGDRSLAVSIKGYCYDCMGGWESDEKTRKTVTAAIRACEDRACALWFVRPYRPPAIKREQLEDAPNDWDRSSRRLAINKRCWQCVGDRTDPAPARNIRDCAARDCPLFRVRPHQHLKGRGKHRR